jgi:hypothetical protein
MPCPLEAVLAATALEGLLAAFELVEAAERVRSHVPNAQFVVAREYGFSNWTELKERITLAS